MKTLVYLSQIRYIQWYISLIAIGLASLFTFGLYSGIAGSHHVILDSDLHGSLGFGLWKLHRFSYYPDLQPATDRGPLYPLMIAAALAVTHGWWPYSVQLAQCILVGALCLLVFGLTRMLWNRVLATAAATLCAVHPLLIWYTSRIWVETLLLFLFTALLASVVYLLRKPSFRRAGLVGLIIGLGTLTKSVFAPYLVLTPLLLSLPSGQRLRAAHAAAILAAGMLVVAPWVVRNVAVTGAYATAVGRAGFTLHQGNDFVEDFWKAPYSVSRLYPLSMARIKAEDQALPANYYAQRGNNAKDASRWHNAVEKWIRSPGFLVRKIIYDSFLFWTLGDTPAKSLAIACLQLPLVALFVVFLIRCLRYADWAVTVCVAMIGWYFLCHLPTIAVARYSVVLVPAMLAVSVGVWARSDAADRWARAEQAT